MVPQERFELSRTRGLSPPHIPFCYWGKRKKMKKVSRLKKSKFVRVVGPGPDARFDDDADIDHNTFFDRRYIGRIGKIVGYTVKGDEAGVGDSPKDPAFEIQFGPAYGMEPGRNLFWTEELRPI